MAARSKEYRPGEPLPGTKYRVVKQLGAGGMGVVYQVVKPPEIMGVLKLMNAELAAHQEFRDKFIDECEILAQLEHPNIVRVNDYDKLADGTPFYVMELLHGRTVRDVIATVGAVPPRVAFEITRQLLEALHSAHTHHICVVHRDIKPENIFLHAPKHGEPVVKLIDFGVGSRSDREHDGQFVGTWRYAAPEQIRGERSTPATDLYSVGLVLYEMLAGAGPFDALETGSLLSQAHLFQVPTPVSRLAPWVPASIVDLIASALAKDPSQRPRDAYAFVERLYELEWANNGSGQASDRTAQGPLSKVLSSVSAGKPSSKNLTAAKPASDRLGDVPLIGVPPDARYHGQTRKGIGKKPETTSPDDDELLAGLLEHREREPFARKVRDSEIEAESASPPAGQVVIRPSGPDLVKIDETPTPRRFDLVAKPVTSETLDAPRSAPAVRRKHDDNDTFASNESDARPKGAPSGRAGKLAIPIAIAAAACAVVLTLGFVIFFRSAEKTSVRAIATTAPRPVETIPSAPATTAAPTGARERGDRESVIETATVDTSPPPSAKPATKNPRPPAKRGKPEPTAPTTTAPTTTAPATATTKPSAGSSGYITDPNL